MDCNHHIIRIYFDNKAVWRTRAGPVQVTKIPLAVVWHGKGSHILSMHQTYFITKLLDSSIQ